ncbi:MAG TPA: MerR family transcriptional regulator [Candidatus Acidoferrales bacterium]|nr:MerR family transcriptional regulator [Candidatus Acidoferrales bacterium]
MPLTVTRLARACRLSRSTVLYYESIGLLKRPARTSGNYRAYSDKDLERLRQICIYRESGLTLNDIRSLLDTRTGDAGAVLRRRFAEIGAAIERLREHQHAIARLLRGTTQIRRNQVITKEKWTSIMRSAGFSEEDMRRWHKEFEKSAPTEHQEFLEFLHIPAEEIKSIRKWSAD